MNANIGYARATHSRAPHGGAWRQWDSWTADQRRHFLKTWAKLSADQVEYFHCLAWFSLSQHVRKSVKRFFDLNPVVDTVLGEMRYSPK